MVNTINMTERTLRKFSMESEDGRPAPGRPDRGGDAGHRHHHLAVRQIMTRIDQGEGSLGALLNDRQLYDRLNARRGTSNKSAVS